APRVGWTLDGDLQYLFALDPLAAHGLADPDVAEVGVRCAILGHGLAFLGDGDFIAASIGVVSLPVMIWARGFCAFIVSTCSGENEAMKSISPALKAAISVTGSLITRIITLSR